MHDSTATPAVASVLAKHLVWPNQRCGPNTTAGELLGLFALLLLRQLVPVFLALGIHKTGDLRRDRLAVAFEGDHLKTPELAEDVAERNSTRVFVSTVLRVVHVVGVEMDRELAEIDKTGDQLKGLLGVLAVAGVVDEADVADVGLAVDGGGFRA